MRLLAFTLTMLFSFGANAQNIERVRITDSELSCRQIHDELGAMDKVIADAKQAQASGETTATAGQVGGVEDLVTGAQDRSEEVELVGENL